MAPRARRIKTSTSPAAARERTVSASTSRRRPRPEHLPLDIDTNATATATANGSDASPSPAPSSSHTPCPTPTGAGGIGSRHNQACAACKYQRRKCNSHCELAPYFPAEQQRRFLNAHHLFGVGNLVKMLGMIETKFSNDLMTSLMYEADARAADPVLGTTL
uniref:LOB domain-containing protein n=1 Tax=Zea mays TaxID=4577 RepID=A0A804Q8M4_MAIZE